MSNYFQTLNRLESEKGMKRALDEALLEDVEDVEEAAAAIDDADVAVKSFARTNVPARHAKRKAKTPPQHAALHKATSAPAAPATAPARRATAAAAPRKIRKQSLLDAKMRNGEHGQAPYITLFENLRVMADGSPVSNIVLAGAYVGDRADQVAIGLATLARRRGLRVLLAGIEEGIKQPVLRPRSVAVNDAIPGHGRRHSASKAASNAALYATSLALDLRGGPVSSELDAWFGSAGEAHDLVIVEAPPLGRSVDAALLARACDGLIIVVDSEVTTRDALCAAVERAQTVGCRVLGLVMNGARQSMPTWMNRMSGNGEGA